MVLPADSELQFATALTAVAAAAYWGIVSWASKRWAAAGWLLGHPAQPAYTTPSSPADSEVSADADQPDRDVV